MFLSSLFAFFKHTPLGRHACQSISNLVISAVSSKIASKITSKVACETVSVLPVSLPVQSPNKVAAYLPDAYDGLLLFRLS